MKWFLSGSLATLAIVSGGLLVSRHSAPASRPITVHMSMPQPRTIPDAKLIGYYYIRSGLTDNEHLQLLKTHRFTHYLSGCGGEYDRISGTWRQEAGLLILTPDPPYTPAKLELNRRFIPVPWGKRLYLVDENQMPGFCASTRIKKSKLLIIEEISFRDYVLYTDPKLPPIQGKPVVPVQYQDFLENGEIRATVVCVGAHGEVLLKEKNTRRLKPGMRLCRDSFEAASDLVVTSVNEWGVLAQPLPSLKRKLAPIRTGDSFTTGWYLERPEGTHGFIH